MPIQAINQAARARSAGAGIVRQRIPEVERSGSVVTVGAGSLGGARVGAGSEFEVWRGGVRGGVLEELADFVSTRCLPELAGCGVDVAGEVLMPLVGGGKCLRSTFMYLGWLCGGDPDGAALRASAGLELLHAFALLQDDVMDDSVVRRGRPAAHVAFGRWHRERGFSGCSSRFGASLAVLLSDLCLVWAEQMMRESGVSAVLTVAGNDDHGVGLRR